jgi:hypothetical protein
VTFRLYLQSEFDRRRAGNPRYSLRAFARALGTDHSTLSQILRARRVLTRRTVRGYASRLRLNRSETAQYSLESALLALVRRRRFRPDSRAIAARLGVTPDEVNVALQRLVRLRILVMGGSTWSTQ